MAVYGVFVDYIAIKYIAKFNFLILTTLLFGLAHAAVRKSCLKAREFNHLLYNHAK
jgi:hypothetical protein